MSTYNSMIVGLALHRKSIELVELFSEMLMERVRRNGITFVGVLNGYSHGGLVDLGIQQEQRGVCVGLGYKV